MVHSLALAVLKILSEDATTCTKLDGVVTRRNGTLQSRHLRMDSGFSWLWLPCQFWVSLLLFVSHSAAQVATLQTCCLRDVTNIICDKAASSLGLKFTRREQKQAKGGRAVVICCNWVKGSERKITQCCYFFDVPWVQAREFPPQS